MRTLKAPRFVLQPISTCLRQTRHGPGQPDQGTTLCEMNRRFANLYDHIWAARGVSRLSHASTFDYVIAYSVIQQRTEPLKIFADIIQGIPTV